MHFNPYNKYNITVSAIANFQVIYYKFTNTFPLFVSGGDKHKKHKVKINVLIMFSASKGKKNTNILKTMSMFRGQFHSVRGFGFLLPALSMLQANSRGYRF